MYSRGSKLSERSLVTLRATTSKPFRSEGDIADVAFGQVFLHVGEDEDLLVTRVLLLQELDSLQQAAGDVGVGCRRRVVNELLDAAGERPLLLIAGARAIVECRLRDDVFLCEARGVDPRNRERVRRLQFRQGHQDDLFSFVT